MAVWAAVGGRATLVGPIIGAFVVNGAKSWLTVTAPEYWLYFLGGLFIVVTLFLPDGIVGLWKRLTGRGGKGPAVAAQQGTALEAGQTTPGAVAPATGGAQ